MSSFAHNTSGAMSTDSFIQTALFNNNYKNSSKRENKNEQKIERKIEMQKGKCIK